MAETLSQQAEMQSKPEETPPEYTGPMWEMSPTVVEDGPVEVLRGRRQRVIGPHMGRVVFRRPMPTRVP